MPKFGAHMLFVEQARIRRPELFEGLDLRALQLGAIGPDMTLFLLDPVKDKYVRAGLDVAMRILTVLHDISAKLKEIMHVFDGPPTDLADWVSGGMSKDVGALLETTFDTILSVLKLGVANGASAINLQNPLLKYVDLGGVDLAGFFAKSRRRVPAS